MRKYLLPFLIIIFLGGCVSTPGGNNPQPGMGNLPWEKGLFIASGAETYAAANSITVENQEDIKVLLRGADITIDKEGRFEYHYIWVYQILTHNGLENWDSTSVSWSPWYQERPEMKIRVSNPDGSEHILDESLIVESSEGESANNIYSDRKVLRAPFPNVVVGSVIEEELIVKDTSPMFEQGVTRRWNIQSYNPIFLARTRINVADGVPFKHKLYLQEKYNIIEEKTQNEGYTQYVFTGRNIPKYESSEVGLNRGAASWPYIAFSTGESWQAIASAYSDIVDDKLKNENFSDQMYLVTDDPHESAVNVMEWINSKLRYTGMELGAGSIIPTSPSDSLARGFGDCKDKATLMIGILRQGGIQADVALIRADINNEIEEDLPGMGLFNHAIVYVHADPPLWFDPTSEFSRDGYLPIWDQDHACLVANPDITELQQSWISESKDNYISETKEYYLKDDGFGDLNETSEYYGAIDSFYRSRYLQTAKTELEKNIDQYITNAYRFGEKKVFTFSDPLDFSDPFRINLEIGEVGRAVTEDAVAQMAIMHSDVLDWLPDVFKTEAGDDYKERKNDYYFNRPFVHEVQYVVMPPIGFVPREIPENEKIKLGTAELTQSYSFSDKGVLTAVFTLDSGKRIISPQEFEDTRKAVVEFFNKGATVFTFDHEGEILLSQGDYQGSLAKFKEIVEAEPEKAAHRVRLARALLQAGLGEEARKEAREAARLTPDSAEVHNILAWILQHDLIGRRFNKGFDRQGSIEAYKKAVELDGENWQYIADLAILLEHDAHGFRYSPDADLNESIIYYEKIHNDLGDEDRLKDNYITALLWDRQFDKLKEEAQKLDEDQKNINTLLATTVLEGVEEGITFSQTINPIDKRRQILVEAGNSLIHLRLYNLGSAMLEEAAKGSSDAMNLESRADMLRKVVPYEELDLDLSDPRNVVKQYIIDVFSSGGEDFSSIKNLVTDDFYNKGLQDDHSGSFVSSYVKFKKESLQSGLHPSILLDIYASTMQFNLKGNEARGYQVTIVSAGMADSADESYYVTKDNGGYRIVGAQGYLSEIGKHIFNMVNRGDVKTAEQWIKWLDKDSTAYTVATSGDPSDPFAEMPFQIFADSDLEDRYIYAAASLMGMGTFSGEAAEILLNGKEKATGDDILAFDYALNQAYWREDDYSRMAKAAQMMYDTYPESDTAYSLFATALIYTKNNSALNSLLDQRKALFPFDDSIEGIRLEMKSELHDFEAINDIFTKRIDNGEASAAEYNQVAWIELFNPDISTKQALEYARRAVNLTGGKDSAILHTLAALYAEVGRCEEARTILLQVMALSNEEEPAPADWYVLGRIAEQYGVYDAAVKAYNRVDKPENPVFINQSSYILAQRRLDEIKKMK